MDGEGSVGGYVEQEGAVGGQLLVAGGQENHELGQGGPVKQVLVWIFSSCYHSVFNGDTAGRRGRIINLENPIQYSARKCSHLSLHQFNL